MRAFALVRKAFTERLDFALQSIGVEVVGSGPKGDWRQVICPLCDDTNGSADVSIKSGYLRCKQCNRELELFTWIQEAKNKPSTWEVCIALAEILGVPLEMSQRKRHFPSALTEDILLRAANDLYTHPDAEDCRKFLKGRNIYNPEILTVLGIGWISGSIIFAQRWPNGAIRPRYRKYNPSATNNKWTWNGRDGATQGWWPQLKPPDTEGTRVVILEGEWDVLTAWAFLQWQKIGIYCYTWTGGVKPIEPHAIEDWMHDRPIEICYDNDVFQHAQWDVHVAPNDKRRAEMRIRRDAMLKTARSFSGVKCDVTIRAIPIDPLVIWGGDFRDWVNAGGRNWDEVPSWKLIEVGSPVLGGDEIECSFDEAYNHAGKRVVFPAVVSAIDEEGIVIPVRSEIDCPMDTLPFCGKCKVPKNFRGQVIEHADYEEETAAAILSRDPEKTLKKDLLGVPGGCTLCRVRTIEYKVSNAWVAVQEDSDKFSDRELMILSETQPNLSGDMRIHGTMHHYRRNVVVVAKKLEFADELQLDGNKLAALLQDITPWRSNKESDIDDEIRKHAADLSRYVTHIHGRIDIHISAMLLAHSALWMDIDGHRRRAWLDISVLGDTSTGKSMTFQSYLAHHGLGRIHTCMENVSRAGLTMGAATLANGKMRLKPGLFPRANRKMLILDEFHIMVEERDDHPMLHLQSARDLGHVGGIKIYGARQLPAAVRLATIANWSSGRYDSCKFPCQHLLSLYGKPESVRRLDFGLIVRGEPNDDHTEVPHVWTSELEHASILRAWSQQPTDIFISGEALDRARSYVRDWARVYSDDLPLFTGQEKLYSLIRVAIAAANLCFSHPFNNVMAVEVRKAHVDWAAHWFERIWAQSHYEQYSAAEFAKRKIDKPFHVEAMFTIRCGVKSADVALRLLDNFFGKITTADLCVYLGCDIYKAVGWATEMVRLGAFEKVLESNSYNAHWRMTPGASELLKAILDLANDYPQAFAERVKKIADWVAMKAQNGEPNVPEIGLHMEKLRAEWATDPDGEADILSGPGSVEAS